MFTAPYDAALSGGLLAARVDSIWATRPSRIGEDIPLPAAAMRPIFYTRTDGPNRSKRGGNKLLKGLEHGVGLARTIRLAARLRPAVVHLQWAVVPMLDRLAVARLRRHAPVVFTVHDTTPFNGKDVPAMQRRGFGGVLRAADRLVVHTAGAAEQLARSGLDIERIDVVPHGLLSTPVGSGTSGRDGRWRIVQFGRIQHYKGVDLLIEAIGQMSRDVRDRVQVVVAGEAQVDPAPLLARVAALGLQDTLSLRFGFLPEHELGDLLASADAFVFPYRMVEASGALHLIAGLNRWVVASDVGAFPDLIGRDGGAGTLVTPSDVQQLAEALASSIGKVPVRQIGSEVPGWEEIGYRTRAVYERARAGWRSR